MSLNEFVRGCPEDSLDTLISTLESRANGYVAEGKDTAVAGGKDWKLRAVARSNMGHALFTLVEELKQERVQVASWRNVQAT